MDVEFNPESMSFGSTNVEVPGDAIVCIRELIIFILRKLA